VSTRYILAHDLGTTGNKAILVDEEGNIKGSAWFSYPTYMPKPGVAEQNAEDWWRAVVMSTKELIKKEKISPRDIVAIGISGLTPNCLPVNREGVPLGRAMIHMDVRAQPIATKLEKEISMDFIHRFMLKTGARIDPRVDFVRILWIKNNKPKIYEKTHKFLQAKDYIVLKLTNVFTTDYTDASLGFGLFNFREKRYDEEALDTFGIPLEKLPEPHLSTEIVGEVTEKAAKETGLNVGTPVIAGAADAAAINLGAGAERPNIAVLNLGGSIFVTVLSKKIMDKPHFYFVQIDPDYLGYGVDLQTGGVCLRWMRDQFCPMEKLVASAIDIDAYRLLDSEAERIKPGSDDLIFLPYFAGGPSVKFNSKAKGAFFGLTLTHTKAHLIRSIMEGIAYEFRYMIEHMENLDLEVKEVRLCGGGSKSSLWGKIIASVLGREILVPSYPTDSSAYGAALAAGVGVGLFKDLEEAQGRVKLFNRYVPEPEWHDKYERLFTLYKALYDRLADLYEQL